jgi:hypothetical protein
VTAPQFYARTAEMVAVLLPDAWRGLGPSVSRALAGLDPSAGPLVDVGAGTGEGLRVASRTLPDAELLAVEPDPALRTALLAVAAADPDLRGRVTVLDTDLAGAPLPPTLGGVLLMNVLGHFSAPERLGIWDLLAARLAPAGRALVTLYPPTSPQHVPSTPMSEVVVGGRRYRGSARAEPSGPDTVDWEMSYEILEGDATVAAFTAADRWVVVGPEQLADELGPRGLTISEVDAEQFLHVITRSPASGA